jgi:hypothetical protein
MGGVQDLGAAALFAPAPAAWRGKAALLVGPRRASVTPANRDPVQPQLTPVLRYQIFARLFGRHHPSPECLGIWQHRCADFLGFKDRKRSLLART